MSKKNGFKHKQLDIRIKIGISLMVGLFVFLITLYQTFGTASTMFSDWVYQSESVNALPVSIIRIDEETLNAMGQHTTWSRQVYADILNALNSKSICERGSVRRTRPAPAGRRSAGR